MTQKRADVPMEDPQAALERALIEEFLRGRGLSLRTVRELPAEQVTALMRDASLHAATKLAEVDARAAFVHDIHGASSSSE